MCLNDFFLSFFYTNAYILIAFLVVTLFYFY